MEVLEEVKFKNGDKVKHVVSNVVGEIVQTTKDITNTVQYLVSDDAKKEKDPEKFKWATGCVLDKLTPKKT
jgi:hypothetical protein